MNFAPFYTVGFFSNDYIRPSLARLATRRSSEKHF